MALNDTVGNAIGSYVAWFFYVFRAMPLKIVVGCLIVVECPPEKACERSDRRSTG